MRCFLATLAVLVGSTAVLADIESGPKAGEKVGELKVFAVTGPSADKEVDYAAERKGEPTVYLFVNAEKFDRPAARFLKVLDGKIEGAADTARVVAVWVGGQVEGNKTYIPRMQQSLKLEKTSLTVSTGDSGYPAGWAINADARLTAVVAVGGKVVKSFAFGSANEKDVNKVIEELKKAASK